MSANYDKLFISLRYYLLGKAEHDVEYQQALRILEFAKNVHVGVRKDGCTPEFQHQLEIAHFIRTLSKSLINPGLTIAAGIAHDLLEDYSDKPPFLSVETIRSNFGSNIADVSMLLSKEYQGRKRNKQEYFDELVNCPVGSIAKGVDRIHNQSSMLNVFTKTKVQDYIQETEEFIIPMLKAARRLHFKQEAAYENIKFVLINQVSMVKAQFNQ